MSGQPTTGPWRVERWLESGPNMQVVGADDQVVAIAAGLLRPVDELEANARLIAAAPDLLAAVHELMDCGPSPRVREWRIAMAKAEAAVAKAEGRQP